MSMGEVTLALADPRRLAVLRATGLMDGAREAAFDSHAWLAARATRAPMALISLVDDQRWSVKGAWNLPAGWDGAREEPLAHAPCKHAVGLGVPLIVDDARHHPLLRDSQVIRALGASAYAGVPLLASAGHAIGALAALDFERHAWEPDDVRALRELSALLMAQVEAQPSARSCEESAGGFALFHADCVTPLASDEHPFTRALRGETVSQAECFVRLPEYPEGRWHRINATPLRDAQGAVRGAIVVGSDVTEQRLTQERLSQTVEALRLLALIDELTGLHNRRGFMTMAEHQIGIANRSARPLLLFFADLDELKRINDTFGHEAGDQALRDAARLLRATFRETDLLARLGGDEFVVMAADATLADADLFASRLHAALRAYNAMAERSFVLSISTGATAYDPRTPEPLDELLKRADAAMYRDKRLRRSSDRAAAGPGLGKR